MAERTAAVATRSISGTLGHEIYSRLRQEVEQFLPGKSAMEAVSMVYTAGCWNIWGKENGISWEFVTDTKE